MSTVQINNFGIPIKGIIHIGANRGQEIEEYSREVENAILIEPIPHLLDELRKKVSDHGVKYEVIEALCSDVTGEQVTFNVASGGGDSSSMLELGKVAELYPSISYVDHIEMTTVTLDDLMEDRGISGADFNVLVIDTQGADLKVLRGAEQTIRNNIDFIYVEVSLAPIYAGGCTLDEITAFMKSLEFSPRHVNINIMDWGNALFSRDRLLFEDEAEQSLAQSGTATQSSTHATEENFGAHNAINGKFRQASGSRTKLQNEAHWQVDLGERKFVSHAYWLDRRRRLMAPHPTDVKISDDGETWTTIATLEDEEKRSSTALIKHIGINQETRFIRLQAQGRHAINVSQFYAFE